VQAEADLEGQEQGRQHPEDVGERHAAVEQAMLGPAAGGPAGRRLVEDDDPFCGLVLRKRLRPLRLVRTGAPDHAPRQRGPLSEFAATGDPTPLARRSLQYGYS
jgi:hypothetical protein